MPHVRLYLLSGLILASVNLAVAQSIQRDYDLSFQLSTTATLPLSRTDVFSPGGGIDLAARYELPFTGVLSLETGFGFRYDPVGTVESLSILGADGGLALSVPVKAFTFGISARGGYWWAFRNSAPGEDAKNPSFFGGASVSLQLSPALSLGLAAGYRSYLGLHDEGSASFISSWHVLNESGRRKLQNISPELLGEGESLPARNTGLQLSQVSIPPVHPVLFKTYDSDRLGGATLVNSGKRRIDDIEVTLYDPQFMSTATPCEAPNSLKAGEKAEVVLHALFKSNVLELSEGTKVMAKIGVAYTLEGKRYRYETTVPLTLLHRNAISWDDDRKAAVFVTAKDPVILKFARSAGAAADGLSYGDLDLGFLYALTIFDSLGAAGLNYKADPVTPYARLSEDSLAIDYLQFPVQTLEYRSGDCDDLSVLYCALLESIGIETAFITVPGHILCAFALAGESSAEWFSGRGDFILSGGKIWVPVEATLMGKGFLEAWKSGAEAWKAAKTSQAALLPTRDSWERYPAVGFDIRSGVIDPLDPAKYISKASNDLAWLAEREVIPRLTAITKEAGAAAMNTRYRNKLGVVYARYGLYNKAEAEFKAAAAAGYGAAFINLGNLAMVKGDATTAIASYQRASSLGQALEGPALEGIIRCSSVLGDRDGYTKAWERLKTLDPKRAERYAYLADASGERAAAAVKGGLPWIE